MLIIMREEVGLFFKDTHFSLLGVINATLNVQEKYSMAEFVKRVPQLQRLIISNYVFLSSKKTNQHFSSQICVIFFSVSEENSQKNSSSQKNQNYRIFLLLQSKT